MKPTVENKTIKMYHPERDEWVQVYFNEETELPLKKVAKVDYYANKVSNLYDGRDNIKPSDDNYEELIRLERKSRVAKKDIVKQFFYCDECDIDDLLFNTKVTNDLFTLFLEQSGNYTSYFEAFSPVVE